MASLRTSRSAVAPHRVLHIGKFYPPFRGGMESHLQLLSEELHRSLDLRVVVSSSTRHASRERINGVDVTRLATSMRFAGASISKGMVRCIAESDADIVHLHLPNPTAIVAYLASGRQGPLVATYHSDIVRQVVLGAGFAPVLHRFLGQCSAIIVASPNYLESSPSLRRFRSRCHIIPFGVNPAPFASAGAEIAGQIRARFGPRIVLAIGRMVGYKGFEYLLSAMPDVHGRLLLIGSGPLSKSLADRARRLGVSDRVVMLGQVDDVTPYHHAADVFVLPSVTRAEAFGIVQLEAMAAGTPIVNTSLESGVPFVSPDGETGLTVPPRDSRALARAINQLLDDDTLRERLGAAGKVRVDALFSADTMVSRTLDLYDCVMNSYQRKPARTGPDTPPFDLPV